MEISTLPLVVNTSSHVRYIGAPEVGMEEIIRNPEQLQQSLSSYASRPRCVHAPIRRRLHIDDFNGKAYQIYGLSTVMAPRTSLDGSEASNSSILTMATSAGSSGTDPWSSTGFVEEEDEDPVDFSLGEEEEEDGMLVAPKLEPMDHVNMVDFSAAAEMAEPRGSVVADTPPASLTPQKKGRGRPRKHPKPSPETKAKIAKGRSKTGCATCRQRKKKCDETKPTCMNCQKNSIHCLGYPEKTTWKSGKERKAEEVHLRRPGSPSLPISQLPFLINGLETEGDRIFLHHYISRLSIKFTLERQRDSAFRNILLPMAQQHTGLMHSILALSSKHLDYKSVYGLQLLRDHPNVDVETLEERSQFHQDAAFNQLRRDSKVSQATYAQMICLVLQTLSDPSPSGQHRLHLDSYKKLIRDNPPENAESMSFIHEFFEYHISADQLICYPQEDTQHLSITEDWNLPNTVLQPSAVRMLGVLDGLFMYMSKITNIRNQIRRNMEMGIDPVVDYRAIYASAGIDAGIRAWVPAWPAGDSRDAAGRLYRQMMWIYLWRTMYPPQTTNWKIDPHITMAVDNGIKLLKCIDSHDPSQTLVLAPAFVIGCAAFEEHQREPIREAIKTVKSYMEYKNTDTALEVLEEVWRLMDAKDQRSWDWQAIAHRMGMDFLAT